MIRLFCRGKVALTKSGENSQRLGLLGLELSRLS